MITAPSSRAPELARIALEADGFVVLTGLVGASELVRLRAEADVLLVGSTTRGA